jgi:hypothetical protein
MINLRKILLGSAVVILPGGLFVAAGYLLYKRFKGKGNGIQSEVSDTSKSENQDKNDT